MDKKIDWVEESNRFDKAADFYDIYRPSYPAELIDRIINETGINPGDRVLEIGSGSGKATELFEKRGFYLQCIEPGENLVKVGRQKFKDSSKVDFIISRFEDWSETPGSFDLAFSAQAFHWVPKPPGYEKCASALKPDRCLALFWNMYLRGPEPADEELAGICKHYNVLFLNSSDELEDRIGSISREITDSGCFSSPDIFRYPWSKSYDADSFIGFLKTGNGYIGLSSSEKQELNEKISSIAAKNGGTLTQKFICVLFLAKRC